MNVVIKGFLNNCLRFLANKRKRRLSILGILIIIALADFLTLGIVRRTFVFYSVTNGEITVEERMLKRTPSREQSVSRYVEEAILGPVSPDVLPLFPRETRLLSLLFRDGVVYADFSEDAAMPPEEGGDVFTNLQTLHSGILRNFSYVRSVKFFIAGKEAFSGEFEVF